jgi:CHAD domain-containing protein
MQHLHKSLIKRANRMQDDDASSAHRTRIAAKRARYALEFFHSLYRAKGTHTYLKALAAVQEELGQHNDLAVADGCCRNWRSSIRKRPARSSSRAATCWRSRHAPPILTPSAAGCTRCGYRTDVGD